MYFVFNVFNIYINFMYIHTHKHIYMCAHIYIYQWWIAEQRQYCIERVTESWVLKAETRSALALCFSRDALQSFLLELRSLLSSWETGKSSKLIPAELRRLNRDLCPLGLNLKSKRNRIVLYHSPVFLELEDEPVVPMGSMFYRETPK